MAMDDDRAHHDGCEETAGSIRVEMTPLSSSEEKGAKVNVPLTHSSSVMRRTVCTEEEQSDWHLAHQCSLRQDS